MSDKPKEHYISMILDEAEFKFLSQLKAAYVNYPGADRLNMSEFVKRCTMVCAMNMVDTMQTMNKAAQEELMSKPVEGVVN